MRLDGLLMGVMLATLHVYRPQVWARLQLRSNAWLLTGLALCCVAFWLFRERTGLLANTLGWPVLSFGFGLLVFAAADRHSVIGRWRVPGTGCIAAISYSLYLSHKITFHVTQAEFAPWMKGSRPLLFLSYAATTLLVGAALHYLVERPFLRWRDRRKSACCAVAS
jgi:peptidoglycan/LPS O-acetylase OafA/YrhL